MRVTFINLTQYLATMVLDRLSQSLKKTLQKIAGSMFVDEKLINELVKDIQRALLQADVNVKHVLEFTKAIRERAMKEQPAAGITKKEQLIAIVYEELTQFLGGEGHKIGIGKKPSIIMLLGLFGSGKTTSAGKLAKFFSKRGHRCCLVGLDIHRPAAMEQLEQVAHQVSVPCFVRRTEKSAVSIWKAVETEAGKHDIIIIDTAGRDALSEDLVREIRDVSEAVNPDERLLVVSADIGQAAERQAKAFHDSCGVTGVLVTKMDGTAKAGGALSACAITKAPITFIGIGEKPDDLEEFRPKNFVGRMLGMGDIESLLEKAREAISEEQAEDLGKRMLKGDFNLIDLYEQMAAMKKMGPLSKVLEMVPGMGQLHLPKDMLKVQEHKLEDWKHIMNSMTEEELEEPEKIRTNRVQRIAAGSGMNPGSVRELLKQYQQSKKVIKMLKPGSRRSMEQVMKKFSKGQVKV